MTKYLHTNLKSCLGICDWSQFDDYTDMTDIALLAVMVRILFINLTVNEHY